MGRKWLSRGQNHWQDIQTGLFRVWKGIWCKARNKNKNPRRKKKLTSLLVVKTRSLNTRDSCRRTNPPFNHQGPSSSLSVCVFVCVCGTGANILTSVKCTRYLTQALCVLFIKQNSCNWQGKSATPCRSLENVLFFVEETRNGSLSSLYWKMSFSRALVIWAFVCIDFGT